MGCILVGPHTWSATRDADGHRTYKITHLVEGTVADGPAQALLTPGLPLPGAYWAFGNDLDLWAFCHFDADAKPHYKHGNPGKFFLVEQTFSTKNKRRCIDAKIEDPLLEPAKVSGSSKSEKVEATVDRFDAPILSSSHEMFRGDIVKFDEAHETIKIVQNVPTLYLADTLPGAMLNMVNDSPLWGRPRRAIKLMSRNFDRKYYGQCYAYYERSLEFEMGVEYNPLTGLLQSTFDRRILDEGTKALNGHWDRVTGEWKLDNINGQPPDRHNPKHFSKFKDRKGETAHVILDGFGKPAGATLNDRSIYIRVSNDPTDLSPLTNTDVWLPQTSGIQAWQVSITYEVGNVVADNQGTIYVALIANIGTPPSSDPSTWLILALFPRTVQQWEANGRYDIGDRATPSLSDEVTVAGSIYVEKYQEVNFLLLGIPIFF